MGLKAAAARRDAARSGLTDDELVSQARAGDKGAFDELYRRHSAAARRTARAMLGSRQEAEDVVADAFMGVLRAIDAGAGPRANFRAYLLACVRNGCKMSWRSRRSTPQDPATFDDGTLVFEDPERYVEAGLVAAAFSSLSACWQQTLWLTAVEGKGTEEVARQLRRSPTAVPALALRAREAFAEAYLAQHMSRASSEPCRRVAPKLAGYVRGHVGAGDRMRIDAHLEECPECCTAVAGLRDVNSCLRSLVLPAGVGALALAGVGAGGLTTASVLTAGAGAGAVAGSGASSAGLGALLVKLAAVTALAGPVVAYEVAHSGSDAAAAPSATAATGAAGSASPTSARAAAAAGAEVGAGDVPVGGAVPVGDVGSAPPPQGASGGDPSTGAPPAPPATTEPPLFEVPLPGVVPGSGGSSVTVPKTVPVTIAAVVIGDSSSTAASVGAGVAGAQATIGAALGPEDVGVELDVSLPLGLGDLGVGAVVGQDGLTLTSPSTPAGSVPAAQVPVPLPVAPVVAPTAGPLVGLVGDLLGLRP